MHNDTNEWYGISEITLQKIQWLRYILAWRRELSSLISRCWYRVLNFHSASSLMSLFMGRHGAPLRHIIINPRQTVYSPLWSTKQRGSNPHNRKAFSWAVINNLVFFIIFKQSHFHGIKNIFLFYKTIKICSYCY